MNDGSGHSVVLTFQDNHVAGDFSLVAAADGSVEVHASNAATPPQHAIVPASAFAPAETHHDVPHMLGVAQPDLLPHLHLAIA